MLLRFRIYDTDFHCGFYFISEERFHLAEL